MRAVHDYLRRYGYFDNPELAAEYPGWKPAASRTPSDPELFDEAMEEGVQLFQTAFGLPVTGVVDAEVKRLMAAPRCSMPDFYTPPSAVDMHKPDAFTYWGSAWTTTGVRYHFDNYSPDLGQSATIAAVQNAMHLWQSVTPLYFFDATLGDPIMSIGFYTGTHDSSCVFDGNALAHATPSGKDLHVNEAYAWSDWNPPPFWAYHLESVMLHEIGHVLGLGHSSVASASMYASISAGTVRSLNYDDLAGIWSLYGSHTQPASGSVYLGSGEGLSKNQGIWSGDGRFALLFQNGRQPRALPGARHPALGLEHRRLGWR